MTSPTTPGQNTGRAETAPAAPVPPRRPWRPRRWRRLLLAFAFAGPGLIAANAGNDAGGIATYASAGAQFGYQTLFLMVLITVALVVVQEMCARLGAYTGEGLGALIREQFSLRVTAVALLAFLLANIGLVVSEFAGIAAAIKTRAPLASAQQAALALRPVAGRFAAQLFALGLLGASSLAAAVVPLSTAYALSEAVGAERSVGKSFREARLFLGLFTGQVVIGAAVALIPGNLIQLLVQAQMVNGVITPVLLTYVLVLANRRRLLGAAANGPVFRVVATVCVAVTAVMAAAVLGLTVAGWFGIG